jgi:hypothetical protein
MMLMKTHFPRGQRLEDVSVLMIIRSHADPVILILVINLRVPSFAGWVEFLVLNCISL